MQAFIILSLVAAAVAMPYGPVLESAWQPQIAHAPVAYAHAPVAYAHAPVAYAQPVVKQLVQPQYVHAAPVVKAVAPAASSYASFTQVHTNHPAPIVKVAQPVYAQPIVKQIVQQPVYAQPILKQVVQPQPIYSHSAW